jgi:uncharacterized protein
MIPQFASMIRPFALAVFGVVVLTGCQTYQQQNKAAGTWKSGAFVAAAREYGDKADKNDGGKDAVIWRLEEATALRAAGDYSNSIVAFNRAARLIDDYDEKAKVSVSRETGALLSNQANLPYRGREYDKVMLSTYQALNYLQLGEVDKARPEVIRAYQRQQEAVEANKKRIEKENEEIAAASSDKKQEYESVEKAKQDPAVTTGLQSQYAQVESLKGYADYVNPFTVFLDGFYFLQFAGDSSDLERSRKSFERLVGLSGDNKYTRADIELAEKYARGEPVQPRTYVVFETGCAPKRDQFRLDIPVFFVSDGNVPYVGAAFPTLEFDHDYVTTLSVEHGGIGENTVLVSSMDNVVGQAFRNELPSIITKTLLSTTIKATASYFANKSAGRQNDLAGLLMKVATSAFQIAVNIADTRTWTTLPKEFQYCSFPTAAGGTITIRTPNGQQAPLALEPNSTNLILVKSVSPAAPLLVQQIKLK